MAFFGFGEQPGAVANSLLGNMPPESVGLLMNAIINSQRNRRPLPGQPIRLNQTSTLVPGQTLPGRPLRPNLIQQPTLPLQDRLQGALGGGDFRATPGLPQRAPFGVQQFSPFNLRNRTFGGANISPNQQFTGVQATSALQPPNLNSFLSSRTQPLGRGRNSFFARNAALRQGQRGFQPLF